MRAARAVPVETGGQAELEGMGFYNDPSTGAKGCSESASCSPEVFQLHLQPIFAT